MAIVMLSPQPVRELAVSSDRSLRFLAPAGSIEIVPAATDLFASWRAPKTNLLTAIDPTVLSELAGSEFDRVDYELHPPRVGLVDEKARMISEMIGWELESQEANALYLDSLHIVFAMHLLRNYSSIEQTSALIHQGGLTANAWRNVNDYIHANLQSDLSISELARIANLSQSHFLRAFRKTVGQSPHRYVLECRLKSAEQLIVTTTKSLSEIARQVGFSSHSHLSSSMRRYRNLTPSELRR
ncbi:helix-turn-helix domain-containing protein [Aquamicrobium segne]|uniref:Helix-turn-helix domain-containing protein n=1 Tax=Aquamicrobium segne TaxID=469547 RepID=A0ABW0H030_9HYPH